MSSNAPAQTQAAKSSHSNVMPGVLILLGLICIAWWLYSIMMDIQTSEALIEGGRAINTFKPNWDIFMQPYDLVTGASMSPEVAKAIFWSWGTEIVFLICLVGWEVSHAGVKGANQHLSGWFKTGCWVIVVINIIASFEYGYSGSGTLGQVGFALIMAFSVMFSGIAGLHMIEHGMSRMSH